MEKRKEVLNYLKVVTFDYPDWIPASIGLMPATWLKYGRDLERVVLRHPVLFPRYNEGDYAKMVLAKDYSRGRYVDVWRVTWENLQDGLVGAPVEALAPLRDWAALEQFAVPDPFKVDRFGDPVDWEQRAGVVRKNNDDGGLAWGGLDHGAMYMILYYLRGFDNLMMDVATHDARLDRLIQIVLA